MKSKIPLHIIVRLPLLDSGLRGNDSKINLAKKAYIKRV